MGGALAVLAGTALLAPPILRRSWRKLGKYATWEANHRLDIEISPLLLASREKLLSRLTWGSLEPGKRTGVSPEVLEGYAREMLPDFDPALYFRVAMPLAGRLSRLMYRMSLDAGGVNLRALDGESVVVVMSHRSNLDYVILAHLFDGRAVLSFAAGEWASGPVLGPLIRGLGSYFVRRDSGDPTYRRALERFVRTAVEGRLTQAIFLEGGLSRDGLPRTPKIGLLDYMLRNFEADNGPDIVFVPAAAGYDRILEDRSLLDIARRGGGRPSQGWLLRAAASFALGNVRLHVRGGRDYLGRAVVEVGQPLSFREYAAARDIDLRTLDREARIEKVSRLAGELMRRIAATTPILPIPLLSHVLLNAGQEPTRDDLEMETRALILKLQNHDACVPVTSAKDVVEEALRMLLLRKLVVRKGGVYKITPGQSEVLRYYANALVPGLKAAGQNI